METRFITLIFVELVEEVYVGFTILQVFAEVVDFLFVGGIGQVVVEPTNEELISWEFQQVGEFFLFLLQSDQEGTVLQVDECCHLNLDYMGGDENTLITCQTNPRMMCSLLSVMALGLTLTTITPIDLADSMAKFKLICG